MQSPALASPTVATPSSNGLPTSGQPVLPSSPYKGLMPYTEKDAAFFFGREDEQDIIMANLMASRLTILYGPSGVGKSSVLRAGVFHTLRNQAHHNMATYGVPEFSVVFFSAWRDNPVAGLTARVEYAISQVLNGQTGAPVIPGPTMADTLYTWTERLGGDLLIILDQFEEYFLYHNHEEGEGCFAVEFPRAINRRDLRVNFLVSIREDGLASLDRFKGQIPNLFGNYLRVEHLRAENARQAILKPLAHYNKLRSDQPPVTVEPALVDAVLAEVQTGRVQLDQAGRGTVVGTQADGGSTKKGQALQLNEETRIEAPYLQLVLNRLWDEEMQRGALALRLTTLEQLGGAERIVRTHLDTVMQGLSPTEQNIAAEVFHHLVTPSGTKIAHSVPDLAEYLEMSEQALLPVMENLAGTGIRILRPVAAPPDQPAAPRYEIFHDVLAAAILDWRSRYVHEREQVEAGRTLAAERRKVRNLRWGLILVSLVLVSIFVLGAVALQQRDDIQKNLDLIETLDSAAPYFEAVMRGHQGPLARAAFSPNARRVATASDDGTVRLWQTLTGQPLESFVGHMAPVMSLAWSPITTNVPQAGWLVSTSQDQTARIWDVLTGESIVLRGHTDIVRFAAFRQDGQRVVTVSHDMTGRVWDAATGQELLVLRGHTGPVTKAVFSPDGSLIVTASKDKTSRVWDANTGQAVALLLGHTNSVYDANFDQDGQLIVTAGKDGVAMVWDAHSGRMLAHIKGHTSPIFTAEFSPAHPWVVTASEDGTARIWWLPPNVTDPALRAAADAGDLPWQSSHASSVPNAEMVAELRGHEGPVYNATFSRDGKWVATGSGDSTAWVWEASTGQSIAQLRGHTGLISSVGWASQDPSPEIQADSSGSDEFGTRLLVTASGDSTARVWRISNWHVLREFQGHKALVFSASWLPRALQGRTQTPTPTAATATTNEGVPLEPHSHPSLEDYLLITASGDGEVRVWHANSEAPLLTLTGHIDWVYTAVADPFGQRIVTAGKEGTARVWDATTQQVILTLRGHTDAVTSATWSPDGTRIVTASKDQTARVWDAATGEMIVELKGHRGEVYMATYSPDGRYIATSSLDRTARVWDATTGEFIAELRGHRDYVNSVAWAPISSESTALHEMRLLTASDDNSARVWRILSAQGGVPPFMGEVVLELQGHNDWVFAANYSPDGKKIVTASGDGTALLWDAETGLRLAELRGRSGPLYSASFSPDGDFIVTTSGGNNVVQVWGQD